MSFTKTCLYFLTTVLMALLALAAGAIAVLASLETGIDLELFDNTTEDLLNYYAIEATPPIEWIYIIWGLVFVFEILWIPYALTTICRSNEDGRIFSVIPNLPPGLTLLYSVNKVLLVGWFFLFDMGYISYSCLVMFFVTVTGGLCLWISYKRVGEYDNLSYMEGNLMCDLVASRLLVQNGIAMYTTWTFIWTLFNGAIALTYEDATELDDSLTSTIMYAVIILVLTIYFVLDISVFEKYFRYTFTPYLVVAAISLGSLDFNYDFEFDYEIKDTAAQIFEMAALGAGVLLFFCKVIRTCQRVCCCSSS
ncbi:uncharacterized protein [Antedon mediterranea]|uniref:uncharacterized protein n=1 Tax=Antedon mediterranea TaxID=105859 RepID=UPI003AF524EA